MIKHRIGKDYNLSEMKRFLDHFVDENFGADRAEATVDYYASKLLVSIIIVDKHGKPDKAALTTPMKNEMREVANDLLKEIEKSFGIEMEQVSLSGNMLVLEKWDDVKENRIAKEILLIAKEIVHVL